MHNGEFCCLSAGSAGTTSKRTSPNLSRRALPGWARAAFFGCGALSSVTLPDNGIVIPENAFHDYPRVSF